MQKESVVTGIGGLIFGLVMGLSIPKLFAPHGPAPHTDAPAPNMQAQGQGQPSGPDMAQVNQVIKQFETELQKNPKSTEAMVHLGGIYYSIGKHDEAQNYLKQALEIDPKNVAALTGLGNINYDTEQFQAAVDYYQKVLEVQPDDINVRVDMASMYRQLKMIDKAIEQLNLAIARDPNHPNARLNLGIVLYYEKGKTQEAIAVWEEFLKRFPNHEQAGTVKQMIAEARKTEEAIKQGQ